MSESKVNLIVSQKATKRTGEKSGFLAELNGYLFYNTNSSETVNYGLRHYWKCKDCPARLITTSDDIVASVGEHLCEKSAKDVRFCLNI
jgi:hypothetical protein